jgi:preprotein translocase subunit SecA
VEAHNFDIRKHLLEYDDVMNKHREIIYSLRREVLEGAELESIVKDMMEAKVLDLVERYTDPKSVPEDWDIRGIKEGASRLFGFIPRIGPEDLGEDEFNELDQEELIRLLQEGAGRAYEERKNELGEEDLARIERIILLQVIDQEWVTHLQDMEQMKEGIGLRGYGQLDPLREYKKEGYALFEELMDRIREGCLSTLSRVRVMRRPPEEVSKPMKRPMQLSHGGNGGSEGGETVRRRTRKVGRNDPCPCGSGKKYKKCCGART